MTWRAISMSGRSGLLLWWIKRGRYSTYSRGMELWILNQRYRFVRICTKSTVRSNLYRTGILGRAFGSALLNFGYGYADIFFRRGAAFGDAAFATAFAAGGIHGRVRGRVCVAGADWLGGRVFLDYSP